MQNAGQCRNRGKHVEVGQQRAPREIPIIRDQERPNIIVSLWSGVNRYPYWPGSFSFQGLAKPRMAKAWPGAQPMRRIAAAMLVSPPLRSSPKTTLRNAAIT